MSRISENESESSIELIGSVRSGNTAVSHFLYYSQGFVKINFTDAVK